MQWNIGGYLLYLWTGMGDLLARPNLSKNIIRLTIKKMKFMPKLFIIFLMV